MRRALTIAIVSLTCASCASGPFALKGMETTSSTTRLDLAEQSYVMAEKKPRNWWCYTRVIQGVPADQICQRGDFLRYSPTPGANGQAPTLIPVPVLALFETMPAASPAM